ncbi:MAG: response regulator [Deltaproteobacteria bacterium]|nr:response regulator [Deltaproteobacteria bacterium]
MADEEQSGQSSEAEAVSSAGEARALAAERFEAERLARLEAEARFRGAEIALIEMEQRLLATEAQLAELASSREAELAQARKAADDAGRAKTAFLANMSHEIRTPLSAVMGYANLIASAEQARGETREWSRRLQRSAEHLLALLDDVLDLAKIDAGKLDLHLVPVDPTNLLEEVGVLMEPRAVDRGLELIVASETELPAKIRTDPLRLRQILVNLVGNAIKYTPRGRVALQARLNTVPVGRSVERQLLLEVVDTGVGIPAAAMDRLFVPFEQLADRPRAGGVGLGLDIARRLARMLGGDITVRSEVGVGSVFTLTLPVDPGLGRSTTPARLVTRSGVLRPEEPEAPRLDGRKVLLVDDTEDNRRIVAHFLSRAGAVVLEAEDLAAARELLAHESVGLVVTDLQLPDGDGLELVRELRSSSRTPVIALTADAMLETRERALAAGVDDFIVKPVIGSRLVARVAALSRAADTGTLERTSPTSGLIPVDAPEAQPSRPIVAGTRTPHASPRPGLGRIPTAPTLAALRTPAREPEAASVERVAASAERVDLIQGLPTPPLGVPRPTIAQAQADPQRATTSPRPRPELPRTDRVATAPRPDRVVTAPRPRALDSRVAATTTPSTPSRATPRPEVEPPDVPDDLLERFYAVLGERVHQLDEILRTGDRARLRDTAHRVAGSGATMGHPELTELGRAVERALVDGEVWEVAMALGMRLHAAARDASERRPWLRSR